MTRKFVRIMLVMLIAIAFGGITACGDSGPAEKAEQAADKMEEAVSDMGDAAKEMVETEKDKHE